MGWRFLSILLLALTATLGGCVDPNLRSVSYPHAVATKSDLTGATQLFTGVVEGAGGSTLVYAGPGLFIPMATGPMPELHFNEADQRVFVESLDGELTRLGLLKMKSSIPGAKEVDVFIVFAFVHTTHNPNNHRYQLDVAMQLVADGTSAVKRYKIDSSEGDSYWDRINTDANQGKQKAADKLMAAVISDIETFVTELKKSGPASAGIPEAGA